MDMDMGDVDVDSCLVGIGIVDSCSVCVCGDMGDVDVDSCLVGIWGMLMLIVVCYRNRVCWCGVVVGIELDIGIEFPGWDLVVLYGDSCCVGGGEGVVFSKDGL